MYTAHGRTKILKLKLNIYYKIIMNHAFKIKNSAATTKAKASVSTLLQEHGFQFGSKFSKT